MYQNKSILFARKGGIHPLAEGPTFLDETPVQPPSDVQELEAPVNHPPQSTFSSLPPNGSCPFAEDPNYTVEPATHASTSWTPRHDDLHLDYGSAVNWSSPLVSQEPPLLPTATPLQPILTSNSCNPPEVGPSTQAPPAEHVHSRQGETLRYVSLSPKEPDFSFGNLGLSINLAVGRTYQGPPLHFLLGCRLYLKKKDLREQMEVYIPPLPPSPLSVRYIFDLDPDTGLSLKVHIPTLSTVSISHVDGPLGQHPRLNVVLLAPTLSTLTTYYSIKVDSASSKPWRNQPLSTVLPVTISNNSDVRRSPWAKQHESAAVDFKHVATTGHDVSSLPIASFSDLGPKATQPTGWLCPNGSGNGQSLSPPFMGPHSASEVFYQLPYTEQQRTYGEALVNHCPPWTQDLNPGPLLRHSLSMSALGKRRRDEDFPITSLYTNLSAMSPSTIEKKYINYGTDDEDGDSHTDTEDESDDENLEDSVGSSTPGGKKTPKHAHMWRKLGLRRIGCSFGWFPLSLNAVKALTPCGKIYNRTSNCTSHYKKAHVNADLEWPCRINICKNQPKQQIVWKGRGKLFSSCEDMGCMARCNNPCTASFESQETLSRHQNKHNISRWLKCQHSNGCKLTFENSDLRSKHHSVCFPGCPNQGTTCTHHHPKPKYSPPTKGQK